jgi:hypothetical protein
MSVQQKDKHAQIIDAAFENAIKLHNVIEREKQNTFHQQPPMRSEEDEKAHAERWFAQQKLSIENQMNAILPIAEAFADRLIRKRLDMEIKIIEIQNQRGAKIEI